MTSDPVRDDAVMVYAWLRAVAAEGGAAWDEIAFQCFPSATEGPASSLAALRRRGVARALASINFLRAHGVVVIAVPGVADGDGGHQPTRYLIASREQV
jgi:hypothetical protein